MDVGVVRARLELGMNGWNESISQAQNDLQQTGGIAAQAAADLGKISAAALGLGSALAVGVGASVKTAADFEAQMDRVKAIAGATDEEFKNLEKAALDLGASTSKSASEIALGFENMAAMGFTANEIIGAMPGVIAAAEASGSDMAQTADVMASTLNIFGMEASNATKVADILAKVANISAASLTDMQYALKYAGPPAAALGISLEELSASIGIMTNAGMGGEQAGTTLRAALLGLLDPSEENSKLMQKMGVAITDAKGNFVGLSELVQNLSDSMKGQTETQKAATLSALVGTEAVSGMLSLMSAGPSTIDQMTQSLQESAGASAEAAKIMKENLNGSVDELLGSLESLGISVGQEFLPLLTDFAKAATEVVGGLDEMELSNIKGAIAFGGTTAAVALLASGIGKLALSARALLTTMGPVGWLITGGSLLAGVLAGAAVKNRELDEAMLDHIQTQIKEQNTLDASIKQYDELRVKSKLTTEEFARFVDINSELSKTANPDTIARLNAEQEKLREKSGLSNEELSRMVGLNNDLITAVPEATKTITDQGNAILDNTSKLKQYSAAKLASLYQELDLERIKTETKYKDLLIEETDLIEDRKKQEEHMQELMTERNAARVTANEEEAKLNDMLANSKDYSEAALNAQIEKNATAQRALTLLQEQLEKEARSIQNTDKDLENTREKLKKITEVHNQMKQIALQQVGLNSEVGKEVQTIDSAIAKLKSQKATLEATTPVAQRNKAEYQDTVTAINQQIGSLESARLKVLNITGAAAAMNAELGKQIRKDVIIRQVAGQSLKQMPGLDYHTGGITGRGQMPTLHTGGLASKFADLPAHNEIDVRLLRNEMVLTETQQANLMRMIDAGLTKGNDGAVTSQTDPNLVRAITDLARRPITVEIDGREVAHATFEDIDELMSMALNRRARFTGNKY
jgi:TP901 family phage tail tape measure protein